MRKGPASRTKIVAVPPKDCKIVDALLEQSVTRVKPLLKRSRVTFDDDEHAYPVKEGKTRSIFRQSSIQRRDQIPSPILLETEDDSEDAVTAFHPHTTAALQRNPTPPIITLKDTTGSADAEITVSTHQSTETIHHLAQPAPRRVLLTNKDPIQLTEPIITNPVNPIDVATPSQSEYKAPGTLLQSERFICDPFSNLKRFLFAFYKCCPCMQLLSAIDFPLKCLTCNGRTDNVNLRNVYAARSDGFIRTHLMNYHNVECMICEKQVFSGYASNAMNTVLTHVATCKQKADLLPSKPYICEHCSVVIWLSHD